MKPTGLVLLSLFFAGPAVAQQCPSSVKQFNLNQVLVAEVAGGPPVAVLRPSDFPPNAPVLACTDSQWQVQVGDRAYWIENYAALPGDDTLRDVQCDPDQQRGLARGFGC